jgi:hypothetical protein
MNFSRAGRKLSAAIGPFRERKLPAMRVRQKIRQLCGKTRRYAGLIGVNCSRAEVDYLSQSRRSQTRNHPP